MEIHAFLTAPSAGSYTSVQNPVAGRVRLSSSTITVGRYVSSPLYLNSVCSMPSIRTTFGGAATFTPANRFSNAPRFGKRAAFNCSTVFGMRVPTLYTPSCLVI